MLLAASMDARRPTRMHISMQPRDEEQATLMLATNDRHLATADVPAPKVRSYCSCGKAYELVEEQSRTPLESLS